MQIEPPRHADETESDTYLVDQVLAQNKAALNAEQSHEPSMSEQLAALRAEISRLAESASLIAEEVAIIVAQAPTRLRYEGEKQIYKRPVISLLAIGILSFHLTQAIFGRSRRVR
ncbi:hypothetical protein [Phyllobacterium endophyticum]|uniref:hypothetical protein n=1 Tax=Phyllobacterium endophyticum TaxID=1149773 RepID=UPI0011C9448B|nr:hypothetical protein [Phyllobacterium endophyticum]TXR49626.1 hypothetical protein FVA77_08165 [Phyllobacterium endophyticum]